MIRDRFSLDQRRTAASIVSSWDDETLGGDMDELYKRLFRSTGIDHSFGTKLIHAERFDRRRRG